MKYETPSVVELTKAIAAIQDPKGDFSGENLADISPAYEDWE